MYTFRPAGAKEVGASRCYRPFAPLGLKRVADMFLYRHYLHGAAKEPHSEKYLEEQTSTISIPVVFEQTRVLHIEGKIRVIRVIRDNPRFRQTISLTRLKT